MLYCLLDAPRDCCKIGFSKSDATLKNRIKTLQTASPFALEVFATIDGTLADERKIHDDLDRHHLNGGREWFKWNTAVQSYVIDRFCVNDDTTDEAVSVLDYTTFCPWFEMSIAQMKHTWMDVIGEQCELIKYTDRDDRTLATVALHGWAAERCGRPVRQMGASAIKRLILSTCPQDEINEATNIGASAVALGLTRIELACHPNGDCDERYPVVLGVVGSSTLVWAIDSDSPEMIENAEEILHRFFWELDKFGITLESWVMRSDRTFIEIPRHLVLV